MCPTEQTFKKIMYCFIYIYIYIYIYTHTHAYITISVCVFCLLEIHSCVIIYSEFIRLIYVHNKLHPEYKMLVFNVFKIINMLVE